MVGLPSVRGLSRPLRVANPVVRRTGSRGEPLPKSEPGRFSEGVAYRQGFRITQGLCFPQGLPIRAGYLGLGIWVPSSLDVWLSSCLVDQLTSQPVPPSYLLLPPVEPSATLGSHGLAGYDMACYGRASSHWAGPR
jgi:hypothetical protein